MVKFFLIFSLLISTVFGDELSLKIQNLIDSRTYKQNTAFINIIFSPKSSFYRNGVVNSVKVVKVLNQNRLLPLSFRSPHELTMTFKTDGSSILFIKIMKDALRNIGYYKYATKESSFDENGFTWTISLESKDIINPIKLQNELDKSLSDIVNISRENITSWTYYININNAILNINKLRPNKKLKLKRSLYAKWINVSNIKKVHIYSSVRNSWYPYISYYDKSLNLLSVLKVDKKSDNLYLDLEDDVYYMKISDLYTLKNLRDDLTLIPTALR